MKSKYIPENNYFPVSDDDFDQVGTAETKMLNI